jgi:hypothetical protein
MKTLILSLLLASVAHAQQIVSCTTLVYQGAPMTVTSAPAGAPIQTPAPPLTGIMMQGTDTPLAFDFSYTNQYLIYANGMGQPGNWPYNFAAEPVNFTFTTNAADTLVTDWNVSYEWTNESPNTVSVVSTQAGDTVTVNDESLAQQYGSGTVVSSNITPGTWECLSDFITQYATLTAQLAAANAEITTLKAQLAQAPAVATPAAAPVVAQVAEATPAAVVSTKSGGGSLSWAVLVGLALIIRRASVAASIKEGNPA